MNDTKRPVPWTAIILAVAALLVAAIIGGVMYVNAEKDRCIEKWGELAVTACD